MQRRFFLFAGFLFVSALMVALPGSGQSAAGFLDDIDDNLRAAASSVLSQAWADVEGTADQVSDTTLFGTFNRGTAEGRATGFLAQRTRMISSGDPALGVPADGNEQAYADGALAANAGSLSDQQRYVRAAAVVFLIRNGFAVAPGGPAEVINRIQTCLDGNLVTNEDNTIEGVSLDCSDAGVRLAVANQIAAGFYAAFGGLVGFDCDSMAAQAAGGSTVESRWAAANGWILSDCGDLADAAQNGGSAELRAAVIAPLALQLADGGDAAALLAEAGGSGSTEWRRANALAAGLVVEATEEITISALGSPTTDTLGNLYQFSLNNAGLPTGDAALAPLARFLAGGSDTLGLNVNTKVSGTPLLLTSFIESL